MKNISKFIAIGSAVAGCMFAGVKLVNSVKKCRNDANDINDTEAEMSASYEDELAEIQSRHAAEMAALEEMEKKSEEEHQKRMSAIKTRYMENVEKMNHIREELLTNVELCKNVTPEEALKLKERNDELLKELREIRM